jgi:hypothetical protein
MYPKYPVNLKGTVKPGDHLSASVTTDGKGNFVLAITDSTQGWTNTTNAKLRGAALASAEVIAEAPSSRSGVLPLANFGTANFTSAMANGVAMNTLSGLDPITMASGSTTKAVPGNMSNGSFSVVWKHS